MIADVAGRIFRSFFSGCLGCISWPILFSVTAGLLALGSRFLTTWWQWVLAVLGAVAVALVAVLVVMLALAIHAKRSHERANYTRNP